MSKASTTEDYVYELLDPTDNVLRTLRGVMPGGQLEESIHADIRSSATIRLRPTEDIDWLSHRVRITYLRDGIARPLLTGIPAISAEDHTDTGLELQVDLYDKTSIARDDSYGHAYAIPPGTNLITAAADVLASTGETKIAIPPSAATTPTGMAWDAAVSKLRIVNDLLTAGGYLTLECDGLGWYRAAPYTRPADRPPRFNFVTVGIEDPYLPEFSRRSDPFGVPNRVRVVGQTTGTTEAPYAEAVDEREDNPFSHLRRGFWRTHVELDIAATNLAGYAARRLIELQQVYEAHDITHDWIDAGLNDTGYFRGQLAVLQKRRQVLDIGGLVTSTVRTVT